MKKTNASSLRAVVVLGLLAASSLTTASPYRFRVSAPGIVAAAPATNATLHTYATLTNISGTVYGQGTGALTNGNLTVEAMAPPGGGNSYPWAMSTICKSSGSWYWEVTMASNAGSFPTLRVGYGMSVDATSKAYAEFYNGTATIGSTAFPSAANTVGKSGVYGVALNATAKTISVYWNGVLQGNGSYVDAGAACAYAGNQQYPTAGTSKAIVNFGQTPFTYAVPSGYNPGLYN